MVKKYWHQVPVRKLILRRLDYNQSSSLLDKMTYIGKPSGQYPTGPTGHPLLVNLQVNIPRCLIKSSSTRGVTSCKIQEHP